MSSYERGSRLRRTFPRIAAAPIIGPLFRALDDRLAVPLERAIIDARVRQRIDEARRRNAGGTTRLRIAAEVGQAELSAEAAWQSLGLSGPSDPGHSEVTVAATPAVALHGLTTWTKGMPFPSVLLATPKELRTLHDAPYVAVFVNDARALHAHRIAIATAQACIASNRGLLHLTRLYHPLVLQAPNQAELLVALRALPTRPIPAQITVAESYQKILFQVDDFRQGGLEQVITDLIEVLPNHKCEVSLLVLGEAGPGVNAIRARGVTVYRLDGKDRNAAYIALLETVRPTIISAHYSLFGAALAASLGIAFVQTMQSSYTWLDAEALRHHRTAAEHTAAYACVSTSVAYYSIEAMGLPADKMTIIPNAIHTTNIPIVDERRLRTELGFSDGDFVFINVAAIYDVKAQLQLVRALGHSNSPHLKLLFVGGVADHAYERVVRDEIRRKKLELQVVFAGQRSDVRRYLACADAFVLPSFWEGDSLALVEALLAGLPIIASDAGRAAELVAACGGILTPQPYSSIVDVRIDTIQRYLTDDSAMVAALAQSLSAMANSPRPASIPQALRKTLDMQHTYSQYARLFSRLRQQ